MNKLMLAAMALATGLLWIPAANADDCDRDDGAAEYARCLAESRAAAGMRQSLKAPGFARGQCDPDEDDYAQCVRKLGAAAAAQRRSLPATAVEPKTTGPIPTRTVEADPGTQAPEASPARQAAQTTLHCTKYFANIGKVLPVACGE